MFYTSLKYLVDSYMAEPDALLPYRVLLLSTHMLQIDVQFPWEALELLLNLCLLSWM